MLRARSSFPTVIYDNYEDNSVDNNERHEELSPSDRVAKIMAKYYTKIDEITQADIKKHEGLAKKQAKTNTSESRELLNPVDNKGQMNNEPGIPGQEKPDMKRLYIIQESRQKVKQISNSFNRTDDDMKKLEREGQILSIVRKNLDTISRKYFGE